MSSNPKRERNGKVKKQGRRKRSRSEPLMNDSNNSEKQQALRRAFARNCSLGNVNEPNESPPQPLQQHFVSNENEVYGDENEDPLLDPPENILYFYPERVLFLLWVQEMGCLLYNRRTATRSPSFLRQTLRLQRSMDEARSFAQPRAR